MQSAWKNFTFAVLGSTLMLLFCATAQGQEIVGQSKIFYGPQAPSSKNEALHWVEKKDQAQALGKSMAWIQGLEVAASTLQQNMTIRMANLSPLERQALASQLGLVEVVQVEVVQREGAQAYEASTIHSQAKLLPLQSAALNQVFPEKNTRQREMEVIEAMGFVLELAQKNLTSLSQDQYPIGALADRLGALWSYTQLNKKAFRGLWQKPKETLQSIEELLVLAPDEKLLLLAQGELLLQLNFPRGALDAVEKALLQTDKSLGFSAEARGYHLRSLAFLRTGQPALAEDDATRALQKAPQEALYWLTRGAVLQVREEQVAMCADYRHACVLGQCQGLAEARKQGFCQSEE